MFVFLFDRFNLFPSLIFFLFTVFFVALDHLLNLERQSFFLSLELLSFQDLVSVELLHQTLVSEVSLTHEHFEFLQIVLFLLLELI